MSSPITRAAKIAMVVAALGYFVDVFDLILFSIVRVDSLRSLGLGENYRRGVLHLHRIFYWRYCLGTFEPFYSEPQKSNQPFYFWQLRFELSAFALAQFATAGLLHYLRRARIFWRILGRVYYRGGRAVWHEFTRNCCHECSQFYSWICASHDYSFASANSKVWIVIGRDDYYFMRERNFVFELESAKRMLPQGFGFL